MISLDKKFLIVGLGLIGGSYASKLSSLGYKVYALDLSDEALEFGYSNSFILNKENDLNLVKECDYIILCLYPLDCIKWVKDNKYLIKEDCIVSDVSGVKSNYVRVIQNELENNEFISMHPMAGKEKSGVFYSDYSIFKDANMIIIQNELNSDRGLDFAYSLSRLLEFKNIEVLDEVSHDKMVSFLSELPHAIAMCLMNSHNNESLERFSGDSFRDLTRIAKINENLWSELFILNKDILVNDIESFILCLNDLKDKIKDSKEEDIKELMRESTKRRKEFER
jgi:prephenate dehydrogenase